MGWSLNLSRLFRPRWWIRHRLKKCGCDLCLNNLKLLEEIWAAEELYAKALIPDPTTKVEP